MVKNPPANAGDASLTPELGTYPGGRNGNPLQYPCLGNLMDRKAWWAIVHRVTKSRARPNDWTHRYMHLYLSCGFLFCIYFEVLALVWRNTPGMINSFHKEREINTSHKVNHKVYFPRKLHYFKSRLFFFFFHFYSEGQASQAPAPAQPCDGCPCHYSCPAGAWTSGGRVTSPSNLVALTLCKGEMDSQLAPRKIFSQQAP